MSTGWKFNKIVRGTTAGGLILCTAILCLGTVRPADAATSQHKTKKPVPPPDLPSGPTGPLQHQLPLDAIAAVAPQVTYQNSQLTIVAPNSTLADILRAVRKQTGAEIEIPAAPERVVTHLGPGPAREVVAELLNGSRFNYVLLGSATENDSLTRVVLVAKTGSDVVGPPAGPSLAEQQRLGIVPTPPNSAQQEPGPDAPEAEAAEDNTDQDADQAAQEAEQQQTLPPSDQPGVKTPQEMLQEMQQRQLLLQQQQPPGQPPIPAPGMPQRPPQEQQ